MQELINSLNKRRILTIFIVLLFAVIALVFNYALTITSPAYFDGKYNMLVVYGLVIYKILELIIIYYLLFHRYVIRLRSITYDKKLYPKLKKHTKLLFFLIPQGNTVFGIIAYKLSTDVLYFLLFSFLAFVSLILIKPNNLLSNPEK